MGTEHARDQTDSDQVHRRAWGEAHGPTEAQVEEEAMNLATLATFFSMRNKILVFSMLAYASLC